MAEDRFRAPFRRWRPEVDIALTPLYVPEDVVAGLVLGQQAKLWTLDVVRQLEREGLPPRRQLFGTMRYWPGVFEFFAKREGLRSPQTEFEPDDGPEHFGRM